MSARCSSVSGTSELFKVVNLMVEAIKHNRLLEKLFRAVPRKIEGVPGKFK